MGLGIPSCHHLCALAPCVLHPGLQQGSACIYSLSLRQGSSIFLQHPGQGRAHRPVNAPPLTSGPSVVSLSGNLVHLDDRCSALSKCHPAGVSTAHTSAHCSQKLCGGACGASSQELGTPGPLLSSLLSWLTFRHPGFPGSQGCWAVCVDNFLVHVPRCWQSSSGCPSVVGWPPPPLTVLSSLQHSGTLMD